MSSNIKVKNEDLTNLPPIPQKDWNRINKETNPLFDREEQEKIDSKQPGSNLRFNMNNFITKIVREELKKLFENKSFRVRLSKFTKKNRICPECMMPENACRHRDNNRPYGGQTMLDKEVYNDNFKLKEVAIVKEGSLKYVIMKDKTNKLSCDCSFYLNENNKGYCKHIKKYLNE